MGHSTIVQRKRLDGGWVLWTLEKHGDRYALKQDNGAYLGRCVNCADKAIGSYAFVHLRNPAPYGFWKFDAVAEGMYC